MQHTSSGVDLDVISIVLKLSASNKHQLRFIPGQNRMMLLLINTLRTGNK